MIFRKGGLMFTLYRPAYYDNPRAAVLAGLSTDTKPLDQKNGRQMMQESWGAFPDMTPAPEPESELVEEVTEA